MTYLSAYRILWLQVLFDLPVTSREKQRAATQFRNFLLDMGFEMSQYSVYLKHCLGHESAETLIKQIEANLPRYGKVHIITITDKQFGRIRTYQGKTKNPKRENPDQLTLF